MLRQTACFSILHLKQFPFWLMLRNWEIRVGRIMFIYAEFKPQITSVCKTIKFLSIPSLMGFSLHLSFFFFFP